MRGDSNQEKNKEHYEKVYANYSVNNILYWIRNVHGYLDFATKNETSWFGLYKDNFKERIKGKTILEIGCGDCNNAAVMAALGAKVYANDIASASGEIVKKLNDNFPFTYPLNFIPGDFLENDLPDKTFDYVIGKAFLHHLTIPVEKLFLQETARLLKPSGEARFFEPAVNNKFLDGIRWYIPVKGRPSKFDKMAFNKWKKDDPHPDRTFSSKHFKVVGKEFFNHVEIYPVGTLDRFRRIIPGRKLNAAYTEWALRNEKNLPSSLNLSFARSQLIIYTQPIQD